jgi:hypothetical protein
MELFLPDGTPTDDPVYPLLSTVYRFLRSNNGYPLLPWLHSLNQS